MPGGCEESHICVACLIAAFSGKILFTESGLLFYCLFSGMDSITEKPRVQDKKEARYAKRQETGRL